MSEEKTVDFSAEQTIVPVLYKEVRTRHYLRTPTPDESMGYRRRSSKYTFKKKRAEATDEAIRAPSWLYDRICERVDGATYQGKPLMEVEDWKAHVPVLIKEAVINQYLAQVELDEDEEGN